MAQLRDSGTSTKVFGAEQRAVYRDKRGRIHHAELKLGEGMIMFGSLNEHGFPGGKPPNPHPTAMGTPFAPHTAPLALRVADVPRSQAHPTVVGEDQLVEPTTELGFPLPQTQGPSPRSCVVRNDGWCWPQDGPDATRTVGEGVTAR